jgi:hypothetical protein
MASPKYDPEHALVLCRQHSYRPGLVLLYEKKGLYREVLQVCVCVCVCVCARGLSVVRSLTRACLHHG